MTASSRHDHFIADDAPKRSAEKPGNARRQQSGINGTTDRRVIGNTGDDSDAKRGSKVGAGECTAWFLDDDDAIRSNLFERGTNPEVAEPQHQQRPTTTIEHRPTKVGARSQIHNRVVRARYSNETPRRVSPISMAINGA